MYRNTKIMTHNISILIYFFNHYIYFLVPNYSKNLVNSLLDSIQSVLDLRFSFLTRKFIKI